MDLCVCVDCIACSVGFCSDVEGDKKDPGCCKKTFLPMTSVIETEGSDKCCPEITLAYFLGPFYTLCCWNPSSMKAEIKVVPSTGYAKLRY